MRTHQKLAVLAVEDNPGDAKLLQLAVEESQLPIVLHVVENGEEALARLRSEGRYLGAPPLALMLLDLNIPKKDGAAVLKERKADPKLRRIPVVILTGSPADSDVLLAFDQQADGFLRKPVDAQELRAVCERLRLTP